MLATKVVLAAHDRIPIMVFDEIDANVGGEMGNAVGRKLAEVARTHQVICITHLPQVAVFGSTHFAVSKDVRDGRTVTQVGLLDQKNRVEEVARMLAGAISRSVTLKHAREMLEGCRSDAQDIWICANQELRRTPTCFLTIYSNPYLRLIGHKHLQNNALSRTSGYLRLRNLSSAVSWHRKQCIKLSHIVLLCAIVCAAPAPQTTCHKWIEP